MPSVQRKATPPVRPRLRMLPWPTTQRGLPLEGRRSHWVRTVSFVYLTPHTSTPYRGLWPHSLSGFDVVACKYLNAHLPMT